MPHLTLGRIDRQAERTGAGVPPTPQRIGYASYDQAVLQIDALKAFAQPHGFPDRPLRFPIWSIRESIGQPEAPPPDRRKCGNAIPEMTCPQTATCKRSFRAAIQCHPAAERSAKESKEK